MNNVSMIGNLTRDCETRTTPAGKSVVTFSIAVNDFKDNAHFFDVVSFNAESIAQYLLKGKKVGISGRLHQSRWQAQNGDSRSKVEIVAQRIDLLSAKEPQPMTGVVTEPVNTSIYDSDISF